jgi:hypothetical protein
MILNKLKILLLKRKLKEYNREAKYYRNNN